MAYIPELEIILANDKKLLTLTDVEYGQLEEAKTFCICVTETRMIVNNWGLHAEYEKFKELIAKINIEDEYIYMRSIDRQMLIDRGVNDEIVTRTGRNYNPDLVDPKNHFLNLKLEGEDLQRVYKYQDGVYQTKNGSKMFTHEEYDRWITHLYEDGNFLGSVCRNNENGLIFTSKKIIRSAKLYNHLLVKFDDDDQHYLMLLCYAMPYPVAIDFPFPSIMSKSARN